MEASDGKVVVVGDAGHNACDVTKMQNSIYITARRFVGHGSLLLYLQIFLNEKVSWEEKRIVKISLGKCLLKVHLQCFLASVPKWWISIIFGPG